MGISVGGGGERAGGSMSPVQVVFTGSVDTVVEGSNPLAWTDTPTLLVNTDELPSWIAATDNAPGIHVTEAGLFLAEIRTSTNVAAFDRSRFLVNFGNISHGVNLSLPILGASTGTAKTVRVVQGDIDQDPDWSIFDGSFVAAAGSSTIGGPVTCTVTLMKLAADPNS